MLNRIRKNMKFLILALAVFAAPLPAPAEEYTEEYQMTMDEIGANAVAEYDVAGTVFQRIADLEQEKVLMQLEKERAQLELDLDEMAVKKAKLQIEADTISGRADEQARKLAAEQQKLDNERAALESQRAQPIPAAATPAQRFADDSPTAEAITSRYKLVEIVGAGRQLQATLEDLANGQKKKVWTGKTIDGYEVRSISLDEGVVFYKNGAIELLNIGVGK